MHNYDYIQLKKRQKTLKLKLLVSSVAQQQKKKD